MEVEPIFDTIDDELVPSMIDCRAAATIRCQRSS